jgi:hypothetical protein
MNAQRIATPILAMIVSLLGACGVLCTGHGDAQCCCAAATMSCAAMSAETCCSERCVESRTVPAPPINPSASVSGLTYAATTITVETNSSATDGVAVPVALRSARAAVLRQIPPEIYVQKAAFLI